MLRYTDQACLRNQAAAAGPNRLAALTLLLGTHLLDLDRVPLSISALTLSHAFVPPEALAALVARHLAFQADCAQPPPCTKPVCFWMVLLLHKKICVTRKTTGLMAGFMRTLQSGWAGF